MDIDIKHKHAGHLIEVTGHFFRANSFGQWNLTDIWQTLRLDQKKSPSQWRTKEAKRLETLQFLHSKEGRNGGTWATKRATIEYAAWVSDEFKDMVFDAFDAVLDMPEVAQAVAERMRQLGHDHSAAIVKRMTENQERNQILRGISRGHILSPEQKERRRLSRIVNAEAQRQRNAGRDWH